MVETFGNNIVGAFTGGQSVEAIYTGSVKVWPDSPVPSGQYYIKWWPKDLSGSFVIGGEARWLQDYNGFYSGPFLSGNWTYGSGYMIDSNAFESTGVVAIETNLGLIGKAAFASCSSLVYFSASKFFAMPNMRVGAFIFNSCTSLTTLYLPEVVAVATGCFQNCDALHYLYLPKCSVVTEYAINYCDNLVYIDLPACKIVDNDAFEYCPNLRDVRLDICSSIGTSAFWHCSNLNTLYLGYSGVCSGLGLTNTNTAFSSSGSIYVPLEWVSEYKSQYSYWASHFYPIAHE